MQKCGAFQNNAITPEVQAIADRHLADINEKLGKAFKSIHVNKYQSQIVAGMNHLVEFTADDGTKGSAKIYQPLPHTGLPTSLSEAHVL